MKKHIGMTKSAQSVALDENFKEKLLLTTKKCLSAELQSMVSNLLTSSSLVEQINTVKQIVRVIETASPDQVDELTCLLQALISLYFNISLAKSSLQKTIASSLESLNDSLTSRSSALNISVLLHTHCSDSTLSTKEYIYAVKCLIESPANSVKHQTLVSHVNHHTKRAAEHLLTCLPEVSHTQKNQRDSQLHSENISLTHLVCQMLLRLVNINSSELDDGLRDKLIDELNTAIDEGCTEMDLLMAMGLTVVHLISLQAQSHTDTKSDINSQLVNESFAQKMEKLLQLPVIPSDKDNKTASSLRICCLLNGVIRSHHEHSDRLHRLILDTVSSLIKQQMYTATLLIFMKSLAMWTASLRTGYEDLVQNAIYPVLFKYLFYVWEHTAETVRQSSREVFSNLLKSIKSDGDLKSKCMDRLIGFPWSCKGKYGFLMEYIQVYGVKETLKYISPDNSIPTILCHVIENIHNQKLANYVSEFVYSMMMNDRKTQTYTRLEWTDRWLKPLVKTVEQYPNSQKHVSQNLIPKIIKVWPETTVDLLLWLSSQPSSSANLLMYLILARRARSAGMLNEGTEVTHKGTKGALKVSDSTQKMSDVSQKMADVTLKGPDIKQQVPDATLPVSDDTWCGVLSRQLISVALKSADIERRLSAFALVCESHKTASPISECEFAWVYQFVRDNSYHSEPSFRQQMLAHLKHFLFHILESSRKLEQCAKRPHQDFLEKLGTLQIERLQPGAIAHHRSVALETLTLIANIIPNGSFGS